MVNFSNREKIIWQEADFYGASNLIFGKNKKPLVYRASWMHGMGYSFTGIHHKDNFIHPDEINLPIHLVNNIETANFLESQKIFSIAVGMPYIYALNDQNRNGQGSLDNIFIPEHNISKTTENNFDNYVSLCKKYKCNKLMLISDDFYRAKKLKFDSKGIELVRGANISEKQSLFRLAKIFSNSSRVFSNAFGSHLFYASISGCDVILIDETIDNYSHKRNLDRIDDVKGKMSTNLHTSYKDNPFPIDSLIKGIWMKGNQGEIKEYSEHMLGLEHKKDISEINKLLVPRTDYEMIKILLEILKKKLLRKLGSW